MLLHSDVAREVQGKARFSHAGTGADDDEVGFVQSGRDLIEGADSRRDSYELIPLVRGEFVEHFVIAREHFLNRHETAGLFPLPDVINPLFSRIHEHGRVDPRVHSLIHDLSGRFDQHAHVAFFPDDAGVMRDIRDGRHNLREFQQIFFALFPGKKRLCLESLEHCDKIDQLGFHELRRHDPENRLMLGQIEMLRAQRVRDLIDALRLHQNGAEHRLLGLQAVRQIELVVYILRHWYSPRRAAGPLCSYSLTITVMEAVMPWASLITAS